MKSARRRFWQPCGTCLKMRKQLKTAVQRAVGRAPAPAPTKEDPNAGGSAKA